MRLITLILLIFTTYSSYSQNTQETLAFGGKEQRINISRNWTIDSELRIGNSNNKANIAINSYFAVDADVDSARFGVEGRFLYTVYENNSDVCLCDFSTIEEDAYKVKIMLFGEAPFLKIGKAAMYFRADYDFNRGRVGLGLRGKLKDKFRWSSHLLGSNLGKGIDFENTLIYKF